MIAKCWSDIVCKKLRSSGVRSGVLYACERSEVMRGEEDVEAEEMVVSVGLDGLLTLMLTISLVGGGDIGGEELFRRFR